jgi:hypothetical protein
MCMPSGGDKAGMMQLMLQQQEAAEARRKEEERAARIKAGEAKIDAAFDGVAKKVGTKKVQKEFAYTAPNTAGVMAGGAPTLPAGFTTRTATKKVKKMFDPVAPQYYGSDSGDPMTAGDPGGEREVDQTFYELVGPDGKVLDTADALSGFNGRKYKYTANEDVFGPKEGGFDDRFYQNRRDAYMGYYQPQLDDKFKTARDELTYALARAGTLNSSMAGEKNDKLKQDYDVQQASVSSKADADVNALKTRVAGEKSALVSQLNATGDADRASNEALSRTKAIYSEKPEYNPLGDIFAGVANAIGGYYSGVQNGQILAAGGLGDSRSPRRTTTRVIG